MLKKNFKRESFNNFTNSLGEQHNSQIATSSSFFDEPTDSEVHVHDRRAKRGELHSFRPHRAFRAKLRSLPRHGHTEGTEFSYVGKTNPVDANVTNLNRNLGILAVNDNNFPTIPEEARLGRMRRFIFGEESRKRAYNRAEQIFDNLQYA